jgi:hypothetical protein
VLIVAVIGITSLRIFTTGPNGGTCMLAARRRAAGIGVD